MSSAKMLGQFKPCVPNSRHYGKSRKAPWQGAPKKKAAVTAAKKREASK